MRRAANLFDLIYEPENLRTAFHKAARGRRGKRRWRNRVRVLERAERLGLITELELQHRLTALTAFAKAAGVCSWRFRQSVLQQVSVDDP